MSETTKTLERTLEKLFDVHSSSTAKLHRRFDRLDKTLARLASPEARIRAGAKAGAESGEMSELEIQDRYKKHLSDPSWSAAFHPARKFAVMAALRSRVL